MTVLIYVDTSKQVGDPDHPEGFRECRRRWHGLRKTIPKAWPLSTRFWNERIVLRTLQRQRRLTIGECPVQTP